MIILKYILLSFFFLSVFFPGIQTIAGGEPETVASQSKQKQPELSLTPEEKVWLANHPKITIGIMDAWAPMNFVGDTGTPRGMGVDYIDVLNQRLGGILTIVPGRFKENYDRVKNKKLDALMDITPKKEREPFFNFTKPYLTIPHVIVGRKEGPHFKSEKELAGKTLALEHGYYNVKFFKKNYPEVKIKEYGSTSEALGAVSRGETDAYAGNRAVVNYLIVKELLGNLQVQGRMAKPPVVLAIGVRKDWAVLAGLIDRALSSITNEEVNRIHRKWLEEIEGLKTALILTPEETAWLHAHPVIRVAADTDYAPVEFLDNEGKFKGVSIDYLKQISEMLGVEFRFGKDITWQQALDMLRQGKLDMVSAAMKTLERETFATFTQPYLSLPVVVFTRPNIPYISGLRELVGHKVAVVQDYAIADFLKTNYPQMEIIEARNISEGLRLVESGDVFAYLGSLLVTSHYIREQGYTNLKVSGETGFNIKLSMAGRNDWPLLAGLLQKALDAIDENERRSILRNWVTVTYEKQVDYSVIWKVALGAGLLLALFIFWNLSLARQVTRRRQAENAARDSEERLSQIVDFLPDPTFVIDLEGKVQAWNRALEKMTGAKSEAIVGKGNYEYAKAFYGERRPVLVDLVFKWDDDVAKEYGTITKMGDALFAELFNPHLGEKGIYTWSTASLIRSRDGEITGAIESIRDVTDRRQIEALHERYEFIANTIGDPMSFINTDYVYEAVNDAWCHGLQTNKEESIGKTVAEIWGTEYFDNVFRPNLESCFAGQTASIETKLDLPFMGMRFCRMTMYPFFNKEQEITHAALITRDITKRKAAEKAQKKRIDELAQARRAMLSMMEDLEEAKKEAEKHTLNLQEEISTRKKAEEELHNNIQTLERFRSMAVGRERQMIKLKEEINELLGETGRPEKYKIVG